MVRAAIRYPNARALGISDLRRERVNLALLGQRIFRVRSSQSPCNTHALVRLSLIHAFADVVDVTCAVGAWRIRQWRLDRINTVAHVGVMWVHACCANPDQHLTSHGTWPRNFFEC